MKIISCTPALRVWPAAVRARARIPHSSQPQLQPTPNQAEKARAKDEKLRKMCDNFASDLYSLVTGGQFRTLASFNILSA